jgi:hypothetical protein
MRSTSSLRRSSERFAQQRLAAQALKQRYSEQLAARTYSLDPKIIPFRRIKCALSLSKGTHIRRASTSSARIKRPPVAPAGGSQAPKISFATVTADIARGQPA